MLHRFCSRLQGMFLLGQAELAPPLMTISVPSSDDDDDGPRYR